MAAGLTMKEENLAEFSRRVEENCSLREEDLQEVIRVDMELPPRFLNIAVTRELEKLEPCGNENPKPLFVTRNIRLVTARVMGRNRNVIRLGAEDDMGFRMDLIRFEDAQSWCQNIEEEAGRGALEGLLRGAGNVTIDMVYYPDINSWNGRDSMHNTLAGEVITDPDRARALRAAEVTEIVNDSRKITPGCLFFCIVGAVRDGHEFARQALMDGAAALVVQQDLDLSDLAGKTPVKEPVIIRVQDTRYAMAYIAAAYYKNPASEMKIIGVTGTKGKTTTTYMVKSILEAAGFRVGLIGTIEILYGDVRIPANNTTPESTVLQKTFRDMADAGMQAVVMEVSSQALMMHRTQGFLFDIGIFTNLSPDHIGPNEHKDFDDYLNCKSLLFRQCKVGIFNADDPYYKRVCDGHTCSVETYGFTPSADLYAKDLTLIKEPGELGVAFDVTGCGI